MTSDDKHYLLNTDNLTQPIQMQLSQREKFFLNFFFTFLKSILNFGNIPKKDEPHSGCISEITWLGKCLKGRVSEDRSTGNMVNGSKYCCNLNE